MAMRGLLGRIPRIISAASYHLRRPCPCPAGGGCDGSLEGTALPGKFLRRACLGSSRGLRFATGFTPLQPKPLSSIIDLDRAKALSPEDLLSAWDDYHLGRGHIGMSIIAKLYKLLEQRSITCRHFVIPLWKGSGYINMFIQGYFLNPRFHYEDNSSSMVNVDVLRGLRKALDRLEPDLYKRISIDKEVDAFRRKEGFFSTTKTIKAVIMITPVQMPHMLFTGLEDYKARGTQASPYLTVTHYTEFAESKDVVLIRGDVVLTSKLSDAEARWLVETTQSFYLNDVRYKLVERFNKETHEFEFKDVLQALEMPML